MKRIGPMTLEEAEIRIKDLEVRIKELETRVDARNELVSSLIGWKMADAGAVQEFAEAKATIRELKIELHTEQEHNTRLQERIQEFQNQKEEENDNDT